MQHFTFHYFLCVCLVCVCCYIYSSVHMEESSVMQGAQGVLVQNWPTVSSAPGKTPPCQILLYSSSPEGELSM